MVDTIYPQHPNVLGVPVQGLAPQMDNPYLMPNPALGATQYPQANYPESAQTVDAGPSASPQISNAQVKTDDKLLQNVTWDEGQLAGQAAVNMPQQAAPLPTYPPMPMGMQAETPQPYAQQTPDGASNPAAYAAYAPDNLASQGSSDAAVTAQKPAGLLASMRKSLGSRAEAKTPKVSKRASKKVSKKSLKTVSDKLEKTDVAADVTRTRSSRSTFLMGALCGLLLGCAAMMVLSKLAERSDYAKIAAAKAQQVSQDVSEAQVESLNDDVSGIEVVTPDSVDEGSSFLDEQLKPDT